MEAGVEFVSQQNRAVSECLDDWADEAEPDESAERLVVCIEFDLAGCATMSEAHSELLEGWAFVCVIGLTLLPSEDADSALQTFFHGRIELILRRPSDA